MKSTVLLLSLFALVSPAIEALACPNGPDSTAPSVQGEAGGGSAADNASDQDQRKPSQMRNGDSRMNQESPAPAQPEVDPK